MGIFDRFKTKKGEEKTVMPVKAKTDAEKPEVAEKKEAKATKGKKAQKPGKVPEQLQGIVVRPLVTEKAAHLAAGSQYTFLVHPDATRVQVRSAIKAMYGILPERVNIQVVRGKYVRFGRTYGRRKSWKKALVVLPKGKTLDVYEGV
jgi:large subunit ribosomal protein L23